MVKRSMAFFLVLTLMFTLGIYNGSSADSGGLFAGGSGTEEDPFLIASAEHLDNVREYLNQSVYFVQVEDIHLAAENWDPIGSDSSPFRGFYNGGEHTISGLTINRPEQDHVGLFGYVSAGEISSVILEDVDIKGKSYVGSLVGALYEGKTSSSSATGSVHGNAYVGGLAGENSGTIIESSAAGKVTGTSHVGGLVGTGGDTGSIVNSSATGDVAGHSAVGGLIGYNRHNIQDSSASGNVEGNLSIGGLAGISGSEWDNVGAEVHIANSHASGDVVSPIESPNGRSVGGLVGENLGMITSSSATGDVIGWLEVGGLVGSNLGYRYSEGEIWENIGLICSSFATGHISGEFHTGGLVGYLGLDSVLTQSYAKGSVSGRVASGGLVGGFDRGMVSDTFATGEVKGEESTGGLIGYMTASSSVDSITRSFWNTETSGLSSSACDSTGKTTAQLTTYQTFANAGWDFTGETANGEENIWRINPNDNDGYPFLSWQEGYQIPVVATNAASEVTQTTAEINGAIFNSGYPNSEHGHVWSTAPKPTVDDNKANLGQATATGDFRSELIDLAPNTTYYARAYARNDGYTVYGETVEFTTKKQRLTIKGFSVHDKVYDGNVTAEIDNAELAGVLPGHVNVNLRNIVTKFNSAQAGEKITVNFISAELAGSDAYKYYLSLEGAPTAAGIIKPKPLNLPSLTVQDKIYDGTTDAEVISFGQLDGVLAGDEVTLDTDASTAAFADKHAGAGKRVTITGLSLAGNDASNYVIGDQTIEANITPRETFGSNHESSGINISGLEYAVILPELELEDVEQVIVELAAEKLPTDQSALALATKSLKANKRNLVAAYQLSLNKTVYYTDGTSTSLKVPNEDIIAPVTIQIPLPEKFEGTNPAIVYIDDEGNVTELDNQQVTTDDVNYLEFETDHFSIYGITEDATTSLLWLWVALVVVLVAGLVIGGRKLLNKQ